MRALKKVFGLIRQTTNSWLRDDIQTYAAALAFFTAFSIAPLLLITMGVTGLILGTNLSHGQIFREVQGLFGADATKSIEELVAGWTHHSSTNKIAAAIGIIAMIIGATSVFAQMQTSLNAIWHVQVRPGKGIWVFLRRRLLTLSMIAAVAFLMLVSLLINAAIAAIGEILNTKVEMFWQIINFVLSFGVTTFLFGSIFKILPDIKLLWRDVLLGAILTAILFTTGKFLIGLYLGHSGISSSYGAAGSLIILLLWVFFSSQILYFGAEFTRVHVLSRRQKLVPKAGAELINTRQH